MKKFIDLLLKFLKASLGIDKLYHLIAGIVIYLISWGFFGIADYLSLGLVALIAIAKEFYDAHNQDKHTAEYLDIYSTVIGALIIYIIFLK